MGIIEFTASSSRKTTFHGPRRTSLRSDELRLGRRFRPENDKSCRMQINNAIGRPVELKGNGSGKIPPGDGRLNVEAFKFISQNV